MTCHELVEFLDRYVDGDLGSHEHTEFDRHLAACPPCVAYLDGYRAVRGLVRAAESPSAAPVPGAVPESLVAAVLAARRRS